MDPRRKMQATHQRRILEDGPALRLVESGRPEEDRLALEHIRRRRGRLHLAAIDQIESARLVQSIPRHRAALAHLAWPFPRLGLPILERFVRAGRKRQR